MTDTNPEPAKSLDEKNDAPQADFQIDATQVAEPSAEPNAGDVVDRESEGVESRNDTDGGTSGLVMDGGDHTSAAESIDEPTPTRASQQAKKKELERKADALLQDALLAMEAMKRRTERYCEAPQDEFAIDMGGLEVTKELAIYDRLFASHPTSVGKAISKKEREETKQTRGANLVYGEITFEAFVLTLDKIRSVYGRPGVGDSGPEGVLQCPGGVFYDLGSGTGKPVIAAAILHQFDKVVGVEILEGLHTVSLEVKDAWDNGIRDEVDHDNPAGIEFIHGDALDTDVCDWSDADVVFANSTCFDDTLMRQLASCATALRKGTIFVTLTKPLPSSNFTVLEHGLYQMSWGGATIYISQKRTDPFCDVEEDL